MDLEICREKQWLIWRFEGDRKRCANRFGACCGSTDEKQYLTFEEAQEASERIADAQGTAFCFTSSDPYVGIDLDDAVQDGELLPWAQEIVNRFSRTYIELSPSFTGLKIYCRGTKPAGRASSVQLEAGAIEVYSSGRFFAFTGLDGWGSSVVVDCQDEIDWLYSTFFREATDVPVARRSIACPVAGSALEVRARAYMDAVPLPLEGGRNIAAYRLAGHLASLIGDAGEQLNEAQLSDLVLEWNSRMVDPLPDDEVQSCVRHSLTTGTPRSAKPATSSAVDLGAALAIIGSRSATGASVEAEEPAKLAKPPEFPTHLLEVPGLIGDFVRYCEATCYRHQPVLWLAAGVCLQAVLCGRKVIERFGNRPNIYFLCLADTGDGKDHGRNMMARVLRESGAANLGGLENPRSGSGIVRELAEHPAKVAAIDEFGRFFRFNKSSSAVYQHEIVDHLLRLYSAGEGVYAAAQYADRKCNIEVDRPSLSLLGTTVAASLFDNLTVESMTDGLLPRMLILWGKSDPEIGSRESLQPVPEQILRHAKSWVEFGGALAAVPGANVEQLVEHTDAAKSRALQIMNEMDQRPPGMAREQKALRSRVSQNVCKLALIYACSKDAAAPVIDVPAVEWAFGLASHVYDVMSAVIEQNIVESDFHRRCLRVRQYLIDRGADVTMSEVTRKFRAWSKRERDEVLQNLVATEQVYVDYQHTNGRPVAWVKLVG
jgi:hypothetical protein